MKQAKVFMHGKLAGILTENEEGYHFEYLENYIESEVAEPVSLTLPLRKEIYKSKYLFPFFDGLIPEGWLLQSSLEIYKMDIMDRMQILLEVCQDCIGAVSIEKMKK